MVVLAGVTAACDIAEGDGYGDDVGVEFGTLDGCPYWSPDGRLIAFDRGPADQPTIGFPGEDVSLDSDVFVVDGSGLRLRRLTRSRAPEAVLGWLAAPTRIVFARGDSLHAMAPLSGAKPRVLARLAAGEKAVSVSRDGRRALLVRDGADGFGDETLVALDLRTNRRLVIAAPSHLSGPVFSPDGNRVAYIGEDDAVVVDLVTGRRLRLGPAYLGDTPGWAPRGDKLAFASAIQEPGDPIMFVNQIHVVSVGRTRASERRPLTSRFDAENGSPVFSPDGRTIVYQNGGDLRAIDLNGKDDRRLTSAGGTGDGCPAFSPDGGKLAFARGTSGGCCSTGAAVVVVTDADGGNKVAVPAAAARS